MDCSSLLQNIQSNEYSNLQNDTTNEIWLDHDETTIFDAEYSWNRPSFWYGILITIGISIITSYILSYHYYPYFDKQQKLIKLKILNIEPYQRDTITPYLQPNTQYNKDVEGIIFDYANIGNISVNSILDSSIELRSAYKDLCSFILISSLLTASYLQFYWVISHWTDSYRSYVETECYYYHYTDGTSDYFDFQVNINKLCNNYEEVEDYIFDVDNFYDWAYFYDLDNTNLNITAYDKFIYNENATLPCYVHKNRFTVRASYGPYTCDCDCCTRCGKFSLRSDWYCCNCLCQNGCGYCVCITTGLTSLISCIYCTCFKIGMDTDEEYKIEQRAMTASSNKDKEYLLTIHRSSGEIY